MMNRLSQREKVLAGVVAGVIFLFANLLLFSSLRKEATSLAAKVAGQRSELISLREILKDRPLWEQRGEWLREKQPKLENANQASVTLLEEIKAAAQACEVLLESPELGRLEEREAARAVTVTVLARGPWSGLVKFMHQLQQPDLFLVFESVNLQIDSRNPSQMQSRLRIARWYASE